MQGTDHQTMDDYAAKDPDPQPEPRAVKVYVASSWRNAYQQRVVQTLEQDGHEVYDFRDSDGFGWSQVDPSYKTWTEDEYIRALDHPRAKQGYKRDMDALMACDVCVYVMPCGVSASWEAGWAVGAGKRVYVYIPEMKEPDLMVKMADGITTDIAVLRTWVFAPPFSHKNNRRTDRMDRQ